MLRDDAVTSVLIGVSSTDQLAENIAAATAESLSKEELDAVDHILTGG